MNKTIEDHDCFPTSDVVRCDGKIDILKCRICGREWKEPCGFDNDYS